MDATGLYSSGANSAAVWPLPPATPPTPALDARSRKDLLRPNTDAMASAAAGAAFTRPAPASSGASIPAAPSQTPRATRSSGLRAGVSSGLGTPTADMQRLIDSEPPN